MTTEPATLIKEFYSHKTLKHFRKGDTILLPDETQTPPISYIEEGIVQQYDIAESGEKVVVNIFKPGAFFPASSAVNHTVNRYYFEAVNKVSIRQASAKEIEIFLEQNPAIVYDLLKRLYRGVDGILHKLASALSQTAKQRLVTELTIHSQRFGVKQSDGSALLTVTAEQLAHQIGLTRETVSRELKKLQTEGVLTMRRGKITLRSDK